MRMNSDTKANEIDMLHNAMSIQYNVIVCFTWIFFLIILKHKRRRNTHEVIKVFFIFFKEKKLFSNREKMN